MSTVPLIHPAGGAATGIAARARASSRFPVTIAAALLLVILYAGFSHGAASVSTDVRIQLAIAALASVAGAGWLWSGTLRVAAPRIALAGVASLFAFAIWSGITVLWSVAPDQTWTELNRALSYTIVLCLAIAVGASERRAIEMIGKGFLLVAVAVTAYALGQKLLPGVHVPGLFNLNQAGPLPRLQEPLGYWNALALFITLGVPSGLALAADRSRAPRARMAGLVAVEMMVVAIGFTYSRGGVIALVLGAAVAIAASGAWLRSLMWIATACIAAIPPLVFGLTSHPLTTANVSLSSREGAGGVLLAVLLVSVLASLAGAHKLHELELTSRIAAARASRIARLLPAAAATVLLAGILTITFSSRGLGGTVSHAWHSFTATRATSNYDPARLLSADSENRWVWWKEAAGAFSDRPIGGWGAGSFGVVHLLYRRDTLSVSQPHSVPLQFLAETGLVGTLLALAGVALLLAAGVRVVRRRSPGSERLLAAALLGGAAAYAVHALYDWDWDIPGVTLPALVFLGVLAGAGATRADDASTHLAPERFGPGVRALGVAALTLCMATVALSAGLPSVAASKADSAVVSAAATDPATVQRAQAAAELASRLDPLSDAGLRVQATIALRQGRLLQARSYMLAALQRDPSDNAAWGQLALIEFSRGDVRDAARAANRVLQLDPERHGGSSFAALIGLEATLTLTPPRASPTAQPLAGG